MYLCSTSTWVGTDPEFVRSRKDRQDRTGAWNTDGLTGVPLDLVKGDKDAAK